MTFKVTFIDVDDVRVLYRRHDLNLSPDPGQIRLCFYLAFLYSFYRHLWEQTLQCSFHKFYSAQEKVTKRSIAVCVKTINGTSVDGSNAKMLC